MNFKRNCKRWPLWLKVFEGKIFFSIGRDLSKTCNLCLHHADFGGSARNPAWRGWKERLIEWEKQVSISRILTFFHSFWVALVAVLNDKNISDFQNCFLLYHCFGCDKDKWTASEGSIWTTKIMFLENLTGISTVLALLGSIKRIHDHRNSTTITT